MDRETRDKAARRAAKVARGWLCDQGDASELASALLFERSEVERLTAALAATKAPAVSLTGEQRQHALDVAKLVLGHDATSPREDVLAAGLLNERGESDRLGSLLDDVARFLTTWGTTDPRGPGAIITDTLAFIAKHRSAS